jgi:ribonuclease Z
MRRPNFAMSIRECVAGRGPAVTKIQLQQQGSVDNSGNISSKKNKRASAPSSQAFDARARSAISTEFGDEVAVHVLPFSSSSSGSGSAKTDTTHLCYVVETPQMPGKFDVQRAKALGLKPGPLFGVLKAGKSVTLEDGVTVVTPGDVLEPPVSGRFSAVICNAHIAGNNYAANADADAADDDVAMMSSILDDPYWRVYQEQHGGALAAQLDCIVHLSPAAITDHPAYQQWMQSLGHSGTTHLMAGQGKCFAQTSFVAATRYCNKLHTLSPETFCRLGLEDMLSAVNNIGNGSGSAGSSSGSGSGSGGNSSSGSSAEVRSRPLHTYTMVPSKRRGLVTPPAVEVDEDVQVWWEGLRQGEESAPALKRCLEHKYDVQTLALEEGREEGGGGGDNALKATQHAIRQKYGLDSPQAGMLRGLFAQHKLWILGTGSAVPSKYRNVTGMLLHIPSSACCARSSSSTLDGSGSGAIMVMDAGEGTWQQMVRMAHHCPSLLHQNRYDDSATAATASKNRSSSSIFPPSPSGSEAAMALAKRVRVVWVSHPHADHHLGLTRMLAECRRLCGKSFQPIVVVAPPAVLLYLNEYSAIDSKVQGSYIPVSSRLLEPPRLNDTPFPTPGAGVSSKNNNPESTTSRYHLEDNDAIGESNGSPRNDSGNGGDNAQQARSSSGSGYHAKPYPGSSPEALEAAKAVWESIGIAKITNVKVEHCAQAYGLRVDLSHPSLEGDGGPSVVYSGDTRPCDALVGMGSGATLLIHEATFGDDKQDEAVSKRHSTIGEALSVASRMGAFRTLLTHFSQRYPSAPPVSVSVSNSSAVGSGGDGAMEVDDGKVAVSSVAAPVVPPPLPPMMAFDFMHLSFRDLLWAPAVTPALSVAFPPDEEEDEEEDEGGENEENEGGTSTQAGTKSKSKGEVPPPAPAAAMAVPGFFAKKSRRACACCVDNDGVGIGGGGDGGGDEEGGGLYGDSGPQRGADKMRRKRKVCLQEMGRQKSRGSKL